MSDPQTPGMNQGGALPLFIVGVGRSGTSLLQSMLAAHGQIVSLPETGFLRRRVFREWGFPRRKGGSSATSVAPGLTWEQWLALDVRLHRIGVAGQAAIPEGVFSADEVYQAIRKGYAQEKEGRTGTPRFLLDKDPRLVEFLPAIFARYPDAQVVHIIRDPRDVLLSKQKAEWSGRRPWWFNLLIGLVQLDRMDRKLTPPQLWRVITVRYEDLITNPETVLRRLTAELDLDYDAAMLSYSDAARELRAGDEEAWKDNVTGPLLRDNREKWRSQMSPFRRAVCDVLTRRHLRRGGYPRSGVPVLPYGVLAVLFGFLLFPVRLLLNFTVDRSGSRR